MNGVCKGKDDRTKLVNPCRQERFSCETKEEYRITAQEELLQSYKIKDDAPALFEAAKNKLRYWKISEEVINKIIKTQHINEYFDIYAEHSGVVNNRKVSVGDYIVKGGVLFDLRNLNKLWVVFDVYEDQLNYIAIGDEIEYTTPSQSGKSFKSKVTFIDPVINPQTRTAAVRLEVSNQGNLLKPDMFVTGELKIKSKVSGTKQLVVPKSAILWTGERSVAYVKLPDLHVPSFEFREVLLGDAMGDDYVVLEGLYAGDEVVTNGAFVIDASAQLNNRSSMMNRNLLNEADASLKTPDFSMVTDKRFQDQLNKAVNSYLKIKDALVLSDAKAAKTHAGEMVTFIKNVDMKLVSGQAHMYWMAEQEKILKYLKSIEANSSVEEQRKILDDFSISLIKVTQAFGLYDQKYFIQFCPMANDNKGGYWISKEAKIRNPYFGEKMLDCGEVKDTIKKNNNKVSAGTSPAGHKH